MGFVRPLLILLLLLLALWLALLLGRRVLARLRLGREWEEAGGTGDRAAHVAAGMAEHRRTEHRLFWIVVAAPMAALGLVLYLVNN